MKTDYKNSREVQAEPQEIFNALTNRIPEWWSEDFTSMPNQFTVRFGSTFKTFNMEELQPNKRVVWHCIDSFIDLPELHLKTEWKDTKIVWEINSENTGTRINMTHIGLTPEVECYGVCEKGWESFIESLCKLVTTNQGTPFRNPLVKSSI